MAQNEIKRRIYKKAQVWREAKLQVLKDALMVGMTIENACKYAGCAESTYYYWLNKYPEILEDFQRIRLNPLMEAHRSWMNTLKVDGRMAFDYIKMKEPTEFAITSLKVELGGGVKVDGETTPSTAAAIAIGVGEALRKMNQEANKDGQ